MIWAHHQLTICIDHMNSTVIIVVCGVLGFGIVWTVLGARETDKKINNREREGEDLTGR